MIFIGLVTVGLAVLFGSFHWERKKVLIATHSNAEEIKRLKAEIAITWIHAIHGVIMAVLVTMRPVLFIEISVLIGLPLYTAKAVLKTIDIWGIIRQLQREEQPFQL